MMGIKNFASRSRSATKPLTTATSGAVGLAFSVKILSTLSARLSAPGGNVRSSVSSLPWFGPRLLTSWVMRSCTASCTLASMRPYAEKISSSRSGTFMHSANTSSTCCSTTARSAGASSLTGTYAGTERSSCSSSAGSWPSSSESSVVGSGLGGRGTEHNRRNICRAKRWTSLSMGCTSGTQRLTVMMDAFRVTLSARSFSKRKTGGRRRARLDGSSCPTESRARLCASAAASRRARATS